ncbi:MAG: hypothetical protein JW902_15140 [Syntrophaceae bacterium]|nr:hypothetical protein [Syntrophaceae bacterium]
MEYLALSYPGESTLRLVEPRPVHTDLPGNSERRGERAPPGDRLTLVYDQGEKRAAPEVLQNNATEKTGRAIRIHVLQPRTKDIRGSPYQEALLAYRKAQMMGEPETRPYLDIRV